MARFLLLSTWILAGLLIGVPPAAALPALPQEAASFPSPVPVAELAYSAPHGRLFLRTDDAIRVIDSASGRQIGMESPTNRFTDMDLSADGACLYAADFGGERIGYSEPLGTHYVHRYDFSDDTWTSRAAPWIAYRVEGINADRFLLLSSDQWVDLTLNRWDAGLTELARKGCGYEGRMVYNAEGRWLIHGQWDLSSHDMEAFSVGSASLTYAEGFPSYHAPFQSTYGSLALSTDNASVYFGKLQLDPYQLDRVTQTFPEAIYAATDQLAFGSTAVYDAATGEALGSLGFDTDVYALSSDGQELWAYNPVDQTLHYYVVPEPATLSLLLIAGCGILALRRGHHGPRRPRG